MYQYLLKKDKKGEIVLPIIFVMLKNLEKYCSFEDKYVPFKLSMLHAGGTTKHGIGHPEVTYSVSK